MPIAKCSFCKWPYEEVNRVCGRLIEGDRICQGVSESWLHWWKCTTCGGSQRVSKEGVAYVCGACVGAGWNVGVEPNPGEPCGCSNCTLIRDRAEGRAQQVDREEKPWGASVSHRPLGEDPVAPQ